VPVYDMYVCAISQNCAKIALRKIEIVWVYLAWTWFGANYVKVVEDTPIFPAAEI